MIIAVGDSFVFGNELADCDGFRHSLQTYSAELAGNQLVCRAFPGASNASISRMAIQACEEFPNSGLIVTWTYPQRTEIRVDNRWEPINSWHENYPEFSRVYFKYASNEYYELYSMLKEIYFLQLYCQSKHIPYLFLTVDNTFYQHENYTRSQDSQLENLYNNIDWTRWFWFEGHKGFYSWAKDNKYSIGPHGHPLESAHRKAAELIKEKFNELVVKHLQ